MGTLYGIVFKCALLVFILMLAAEATQYAITGQSSAVSFYTKVRGGRWPNFGIGDLNFKTPKLPDLGNLPEIEVFKEKEKPRLVYKWTDLQGVVHYSAEAPEGEALTQLLIDPNAEHLNLMPEPPAAIDTLGIKQSNDDGGDEPSRKDQMDNLNNSLPKARQLLDEAKNVQQLLDSRSKNLEQVLGE